MTRTINAKELRASLPEIVRRTRRGERFVVLYRSRPAFEVVPIGDRESGGELTPLEEDSLFEAEAVGAASDGLSAADHDRVLYGAKG